jgi:dihydroorotate dehydrogenase (NAD+) catalytic subunit|uniref:FAD-binding FR-type domain-containing protein n=1 Tax=Eutreptiella gymnastica TaxID=73025 RepID=A0A7S4FPJ9_9EUGL|mmetsp:Transcript_68619/g.114642  ORF Transcript_68619/g.114642 Transcript_68619/m.114642 type:complete len:774 (+) Transcript_68619:65-2386(+)
MAQAANVRDKGTVMKGSFNSSSSSSSTEATCSLADTKTPFQFLGRDIPGPFTIGSGILTVTCDTIRLFAEHVPQCGVITTKSIGVGVREGNREPVIAGLGSTVSTATSDGIVNAVGLANPGAPEFLKELKPLYEKVFVGWNEEERGPRPFLLVSIFGGTASQFAEVASALAPYCDGLELNFSCPHAEGHGQAICAVAGLAAEAALAVENAVAALGLTREIPIVPKLSPNLDEATLRDVVASLIAIKTVKGFTAGNTYGPMENRVEVRSNAHMSEAKVLANVLSKGRGGQSGPVMKAPALELCRIVKSLAPAAEVIGMGGIASVEDCLQFREAGATVLGVGSALIGLDTRKCREYFATLLHGLERAEQSEQQPSGCEGKSGTTVVVDPPGATEASTSAKDHVSDSRVFKRVHPMSLMKHEEFLVAEKKMINPKLALITFERSLATGSNIALYDPGQFLELWVPELGEKPFAPSIVALTPKEDGTSTYTIELAVGDVGKLSHHLVNDTKVGESVVYIRGPYGKGFSDDAGHSVGDVHVTWPQGERGSAETCPPSEVQQPAEYTHILVGGGTGIAPLLLLAKRLHADQGVSKDRIAVFLGGRSAENLYYEEEFKAYSAVVVSATNDGSAGVKGFVTTALEEYLGCNPSLAAPRGRVEAATKVPMLKFYNCGPEIMMVNAVKAQERVLQARKNAFLTQTADPAPQELLSFMPLIECSIERYMKCGVGLCGVCSCDGYRTCVDGPVFNYDFVKRSMQDEEKGMFGRVHRNKCTQLLEW